MILLRNDIRNPQNAPEESVYPSILLFVILVLTSFGSSVEAKDGNLSRDRHTLNRNSGTFARRKRTAKIIGIEILMGMRAARTLLAGAKQTHSQYLIRQFEKPGTYDQVLKEFNSVHPTDVQEFDLPGVVEGKTGRVVDRVILVESEGDLGKPIMEIFQNKGTHYERLDRIIYTNKH